MTKSICNCNSLDDEKNNIKLKMNDSLEISIWSLEERIWEIECDMYSMKPDSNKFINKKVEINGKEMLVICESSGVNVSDVFLISRKKGITGLIVCRYEEMSDGYWVCDYIDGYTIHNLRTCSDSDLNSILES